MSDWRGTCRQCGATPMKGRAWCRDCLMRMRITGVTDFHDSVSYDEARKAGAPGVFIPFLPPRPNR